LAYNLKDKYEIDATIRSAQGSFQATQKQLFGSKENKCDKKIAYEGLVLGILLYGFETWSLPKQQQYWLVHRYFITTVVTMWHVREHTVTKNEPRASDAVGTL
jgi:hypothetical protein